MVGLSASKLCTNEGAMVMNFLSKVFCRVDLKKNAEPSLPDGSLLARFIVSSETSEGGRDILFIKKG